MWDCAVKFRLKSLSGQEEEEEEEEEEVVLVVQPRPWGEEPYHSLPPTTLQSKTKISVVFWVLCVI